MAVPTVTSISPTIGHTGGRTLVAIEGTGFRLPVSPAPVNGITPVGPTSVRVTFGGVLAATVAVAASTLIYATTSIADPSTGPVDVVVTNLDDNGNPISGETGTLVQGWRYVRPSVTDGRSDIVRLIDTFVDELKRQIVPNVVWPQNTDFDPDTSDTLSIIDLPEFPGLMIAAAELADNDFYAERSQIEVPDPDDPTSFTTVAAPDTVDIVFTIVGVSDNSKELINLAATTKRFFKKNITIAMARDPNDASKGTVSYELTAKDARGVKLEVAAKENNLRTFAISARIVGFDIESMVILDEDGISPEESEARTEVGGTLESDPVLSVEPK